MQEDKTVQTYGIRITGLVQGVGFRPFVYRVATSHNLRGTVDNRNDGVFIMVNASENIIDKFVDDLHIKAPLASVIENISVCKIEGKSFIDFSIVKSNNNIITDEITEISPDIAVCDACLKDMRQQSHRINYPFINCTNCGPRFTIVKGLPYDRPNTTMKSFKMCIRCKKEYSDVKDRRFHAQPIACNNCGPYYSLYINNKVITDINILLENVVELLEKGETVTLKGLGGYNLICDATNNDAVDKLRKSKYRDGKPLAVLFRNLETIKKYTFINTEEETLLHSWRRPIVLLKSKIQLAKGVSVGFGSVGAFLPYMPFHYLFFDKSKCDAIVLTSANRAGEPIIIDNRKAKKAFKENTAAVVTYNRDIYNRTDDSVAIVINNKPRLIRRSRGYTPSPIRLVFNANGIMATGAELVNTFCIGRTSQAILSQHIGDLKNAKTLEFFEESISRYKKLFKFTPTLVVSDLHPDYLSTRYAEKQQLPILKVQHHHAHMASCMAENNIDEPVIGIIFDGTGLGTDGNIWGGEFFTGDLLNIERYSHFNYIALPGGDKVTQEPWRTALSYLYYTFGKEFLKLKIPFVNNLDKSKADIIIQIIDKKLNSPLSSSAGRLFDAVSAILNICTVSKFHAEAPMRLEDAIGNCKTSEVYPYGFKKTIDFRPTIKKIVEDIIKGCIMREIAAKFHNTLIEISDIMCSEIRKETGLNKVVLSGGTFQNRYLSQGIENRLMKDGFKVFIHQKVPANDGGISLGQLAIAAKRRQKFRV